MRWGSPTATTPFELLGLAPKGDTEIFWSCHELNGQFDKLTDRTEGTQASELTEGALPKPYIYTVAHASGSESSVLFPWLILLLLLGFPSVFFRVRPWLMLLLILGLISVAQSKL